MKTSILCIGAREVLLVFACIIGSTIATANARHSLAVHESVDSILCAVYNADQNMRKEMNDLNGKFPSKEVFLKLKAIDSLNQRVVFSILDSIGWPPKLSETAKLAIFVVVDHSGLKYAEKYFHLLKEQADNGNLDSHLVATLEDRICMWSGRKQIYGTQSINIEGKIYIWPVQQPDLVDSLRNSVELAPMDKYIQQLSEAFGIECVWDRNMPLEAIPSSYFRKNKPSQ